MTAPKERKDRGVRELLAIGIVGIGVLGVLGLSAILLFRSGDAQAENSRLVFSSVLPLLGTWVGTILAFYFARENLQAATESTLALAGQRRQDTPVTSVMIAANDIVAYDLGASDTLEDIELQEIRTRMGAATPPRRRLPIRDASGAVIAIVHDSLLLGWAQKTDVKVSDLTGTFGELLADSEFEALAKALGFVAQNANLAQARSVMASVKYCNDVFVTAHGKSEEAAVGWLTNVILAEVA